MYLSVYYSSINAEVLPVSAVGSRLGFLVMTDDGLKYVSSHGHLWPVFPPAIKASPARLSIMHTPLQATSPKTSFLQIWVWCYLKQLDSFETFNF